MEICKMKLTKTKLKEIIKEELLNEIPGSVTRFRQWQEHIRQLDKLFIGAHWVVKAIPHKKKEAREIQKLTQKLKNLVEIIVGQVVDM